jgi:hypothetical protein
MTCSAIIPTRFDVFANPNPFAGALPRMLTRIVSVFIPTTSLAKSISGSSELLLLIAKSVWINP